MASVFSPLIRPVPGSMQMRGSFMFWRHMMWPTVLVSICCNKYDQKQLREEKDLFDLSGHSPIIEGRQNRNSSGNLKAGLLSMPHMYHS